MDHIGPLYCETLIDAANRLFPIEPLNTLTSIIPVGAGLLALWWLWRNRYQHVIPYALALLALLTGIGSVLWHGTRTSLALSFDVVPGLLYFLLILVAWPSLLANRFWGYAALTVTIGGTWGLTYSFPPLPVAGPPLWLFGVSTAVAVFLLSVTYVRARWAFTNSCLMVVAALAAALFRTIDLLVCDVLPFGTHFLWHIFLGVAAYAGVRLTAQLGARRVS